MSLQPDSQFRDIANHCPSAYQISFVDGIVPENTVTFSMSENWRDGLNGKYRDRYEQAI